MRRILLDTSAYAAFMRAHPDVKRAVQQAEEIYLNPVVLGELYAGFIGGRYRQKNEAELQSFLASPRARVVGMDEETAQRYAVIFQALRAAGTPIPTNDIWVGATAMQYGLRILTTDAHYRKVTQVLVDCFD